jgi:hypothetical protein
MSRIVTSLVTRNEMMASESPQYLLLLFNNNEARLEFDPVDVSDNPASVAFHAAFQWNMAFQQCSFLDRQARKIFAAEKVKYPVVHATAKPPCGERGETGIVAAS